MDISFNRHIAGLLGFLPRNYGMVQKDDQSSSRLDGLLGFESSQNVES